MQATGQIQRGSLWRDLCQVVRANGVRALWRGNLTNCLKVGPTKAVKFASYEASLKLICADAERPTALESCFAASTVALITSTAVHPLDTVKTKLTMGARPHGMVAMFRHTWRAEGAAGFMAGLSPSLMSTVPFIGVSMGSFTVGKRLYNDSIGAAPGKKPPNKVVVGLSCMSTVAAEVVSYPFFCIKMNSQAGGGGGIAACGRRIISRGGPLALYSGVGVGTLKTIPTACITFMVYENVKEFLDL